jgi:hypothetical protein
MESNKIEVLDQNSSTASIAFNIDSSLLWDDMAIRRPGKRNK